MAKEALDSAGIDGRSLAGIGITNQRETVVAWDRDSGEPLAPGDPSGRTAAPRTAATS